MLVSIIRLYDLLKSRLGEEEAETFVEILEKKVDEKFEEKKNSLATKEDLSGLRSEVLRTIYLGSPGQLIAIIASVISIILVLKK